MFQTAERCDLSLKPLDGTAVARSIRPENLQGPDLAQPRVPRPVDDTHSAPAQGLDQPVIAQQFRHRPIIRRDGRRVARSVSPVHTVARRCRAWSVPGRSLHHRFPVPPVRAIRRSKDRNCRRTTGAQPGMRRNSRNDSRPRPAPHRELPDRHRQQQLATRAAGTVVGLDPLNHHLFSETGTAREAVSVFDSPSSARISRSRERIRDLAT